jgi:hypothetical protein
MKLFRENMRYIINTIIVLFFVGCAVHPPLTEEQKIYQKVVETDGKMDDLYVKSLEWATSKLTGNHQLVFQTSLLDKGRMYETGVLIKDKEGSYILANGYLEIVTLPILKIKYQIKLQSKENKIRITFSNFQYWFDAGINMRSWEDIQPQMLNKITPEFDKLIEDLEKNIKSVSVDNNW